MFTGNHLKCSQLLQYSVTKKCSQLSMFCISNEKNVHNHLKCSQTVNFCTCNERMFTII